MRIPKSNMAQPMPTTRNIHNPRPLRLKQLPHNQIRKQKMPQMTRRELRLKPILRELILRRHNRSVVNQHVNLGHIGPRVHLLSSGSHRLHGPEVHDECFGLHIGVQLRDGLRGG